MSKLSAKQQQKPEELEEPEEIEKLEELEELEKLATLADEDIHTSDIPEIQDRSKAERGRLHRPGAFAKTPIPIRPGADPLRDKPRRPGRGRIDTAAPGGASRR